MNAAQLLLDNLERFGEYTLLHFAGRSLTNREIERRSARLAAVLRRHGVAAGDRVLMQMPNSPDVVTSFLAIWRLGAVPLPATPQLGGPEIRYLLEDSEARLVLTAPELAARPAEAGRGLASLERILCFGSGDAGAAAGAGAPGAGPAGALPEGVVDLEAELAAATPWEPLLDCDPDRLALLLYTSGTTGRPKGVMLSQRATVGFGHPHICELEPGMTTLHVLPLSHGFGVVMTLFGLIKGMQAAILPRWDTRAVLETIERLRVRRFAMVPTMLTYLLEHPERERFDTSSLEVVWTGGAATPIELRREFERAFGCRITDGYGLTECNGSAVAYWDGDEFRPGSAGRAMPDTTLRIVDEEGRDLPAGSTGEILIRNGTLMTGYWRQPEATAAVIHDGWLRTGDLGRLDADGFLYIVGRKKDLIIKGGENIAPREIEEALYQHPAVVEAAVVGVPDARFGEDIWAAVELRPGAEASEEELRAHVAKRLTRFKVPARVVRLEVMPKNATGKIQKREVKEILSAEGRTRAAG